MDDDPRDRAEEMIVALCNRVERVCRYSSLNDEEVDESSMTDREIVLKLYEYYKDKGNNEEEAGRLARVQAIRLIWNEMFA